MLIKLLINSNRSFSFAILIMALILAPACKSQETKALEVVEEHLKATDPEFKEVKLELFRTNSNSPDKAYIAVSGTRGFVSGGSKAQPDFRGYILMKEGGAWKIAPGKNPPENVHRYTTSPEEADKILGGSK
jgi:hypothetical protein